MKSEAERDEWAGYRNYVMHRRGYHPKGAAVWIPRRRQKNPDRLDPLFGPLAIYNAERHRGIVHTPEYDAKMADLQRRYDVWLAGPPEPTRPDPGVTEYGHGRPPAPPATR